MKNLNYNTNTVRDFNRINPVVMTMSENKRKLTEREEAIKWFFEEIETARRIADEEGWIPIEEVEKELGYGIDENDFENE